MIVVVMGMLLLVYRNAPERQAVALSGAVAMVVQMGAFAAAFALARTNVIAGWGLGAVLRLVALALYALLVAPQLGLPLTAALVSLALYLFLSTLIEPFFLKR